MALTIASVCIANIYNPFVDIYTNIGAIASQDLNISSRFHIPNSDCGIYTSGGKCLSLLFIRWRGDPRGGGVRKIIANIIVYNINRTYAATLHIEIVVC